ncbi:hypothetical protein Emed_006087 [Eimeria media]
MEPFRVAISGSHGLVGSYLMQLMKDPSCRISGRPVSVSRLLRTFSLGKGKPPGPSAECKAAVPEQYTEHDILWAPRENWIEGHKLEGLDAVIHLAGEPVAEKGEVAGDPAGLAAPETEVEGASTWGIGQKLYENEWMRALGSWNAAKKNEIHDSRVRTTLLLASAFSELKNPPKRFLVASGIGVYGTACGDEICDETKSPGTTFVASVSKDTEAAAMSVNGEPGSEEKSATKTVFLRFAPVLSLKGGVLPRMRAVSEMRVGSRYGDGRQWMSWVSLLDACKAILFLLDSPSIEGPVNICSPEPVRNSDFCAALKELTHPKAWFYLPLPIPASVLRFALGQLADELLLNGQRGAPKKLESQGFVFTHSELLPALQWCWAEGTGASHGSKQQHKSPRSSMEKGATQKQLKLTSHSAALSGQGAFSFKLATDVS